MKTEAIQEFAAWFARHHFPVIRSGGHEALSFSSGRKG
jgi:hypothetical protein